MWIHDYPTWPHFTWRADRLNKLLAEIRFQQGHLLGKMQSLGFELKQEASLKILTSDVVKSTAIEGENLNALEVRSSIARRLGMDIGGFIPSSRDVEGIVEVMLDATQFFAKPLNKERLFDWHAALFPTGRSGMHRIQVGDWRTTEAGPMQVISGAMGREKIHFKAQPAKRLDKEMESFLQWFEKEMDIDSVLKAGIAHLWFVTIHPFEDGNGRIARAIGDMALARAESSSERFYSLSAQIEAERKDYYSQLERQQRSGTDITYWLEWFLACLGRAILSAEKTLHQVMFKARIWEMVNQYALNSRQRTIINQMLDEHFEGYMNTSKYAKLAKCSNDTALRDIQELKTHGILIQNEAKGRSTSYRLIDAVQ